MRKSLTVQRVTLTAAIFFSFSLIIGCGSGGGDLPKQISGTWQRTAGDGNIDINLATEPKTLALDGQSYTATIESIDTGAHSVHLNVETGTGQKEKWIIRQIWDDNGSNFDLGFIRNGAQEKLVNGKRS